MGEDQDPRQKLRPVWNTSSLHRAEIEAIAICGCFFCERVYKPSEIVEWTDRRSDDGPGQTALCPYCGIDSVIGSGSGNAITPDLLSRLRKAYFW